MIISNVIQKKYTFDIIAIANAEINILITFFFIACIFIFPIFLVNLKYKFIAPKIEVRNT